ncbi:MAG: CocE/NonD family hydrolase [Acidobacteriaceae bacterium]
MAMQAMKPRGAVITACFILLTFSSASWVSAQTKGEAEGNADYAVGATSAAPHSDGGYIVEKNVMVTMRDGVNLAADIYRPAKDGVPLPGKFPVLVDRSPYNKSGISKEGTFFAQHGYVEVAQDCRGRFASQGKFYPRPNEGEDGYDTIEWAATQPWSNGKIGTVGASYGAEVQYAAAMLDPPHLVAMFPVVGGSGSSLYPDGVPGLSESQWILYMAETSDEAKAHPELRAKLAAIFAHPNPWLLLPPAQRGEIFKPLLKYDKMFRATYTPRTLDSDKEQQNFRPAGNYQRFKDVPMYFISGWYDGTVGGVIENFEQLSKLQKSPKKLMIGPWPHATGRDTCGEADFGSAAAVDEQAMELDWFNHWMKGRPFRVIGPAPIRIFRMGGGTADAQAASKVHPGGKWIPLQEWPPLGARAVKLYLQPQGLLRNSPPGSEGSSSLEDDPANPVPTRGGHFHGDCVQDQAELEKRPDVLTFTTPVLKAPITITGDVTAELWISSTAPNTDFIAKLTDVYPNGYSMILAEGEIRARYRNGTDKPALLKPGTVNQLHLHLGPIANLFVAGHRIRLDISSTDFPRLEPNSNTCAPAGQWTVTVKARNTVYYGGQHTSSLMLPVLSDNPH